MIAWVLLNRRIKEINIEISARLVELFIAYYVIVKMLLLIWSKILKLSSGSMYDNIEI